MKSTISRRTLIAGAFAAPAVLTLPRGAQAATNLTLGHNAAPGNPRSIATERFGELVKERTGGRISVRVAGSEQLGNEQSLLTSLRTGAVDMTVNSQGSTSALVPELAALGLPFLFEDSAAAFKVLEGPIGEELAQRFSKVQMVPLGWWDNGIRHITNSKRPVAKPADLKGLKIRTPPDPMTIDIFQALGAGTEQISFGELYVALQQGVVDGQENPLTNIASSKLFEVNKFISLSGHKWESSPFLMSQITWTRLPAADREIIKAAAKEAGDLQRKLFAENEAKFNSEFRANPKLAVNEVDKPAFREASAKVVDTWRAKPFGEFVDRLAKTARS
ncbi:TRAP transporter substrate-binding protein [Microvirga terrae]|uniref:TRAP transporter substrate-binding protein n=1 Tax=Microvirga terrae TaxID=2740529 RepID=A0ABY5RXC0_9HYPH|nr:MULTISPECIES: TRAP transporter substrate-binding protein [Microvirga]MBQ0821380.1 TRAP transporter substrate-binding protein [Microvirga sp. HBU67558]UVF21673.1 TRAP transporter substrate-binding protein [Microvirga terrae]